MESSGGFGSVRQIRHKSTGKSYAMKIIEKKNVGRRQLDEVQSEISVLETCNHGNVIFLQEIFQSPTQYIIIMEL